MKPARLASVVVAMCVASVSPPTARGAVLDQSSFSHQGDNWFPQTGQIGADNGVPFPGGIGYSAQAQTFTAGISGKLDTVGVHLQSFIPDVTEPLLMASRPTVSGTPASDASSDFGVAVVSNDFYAVSLPGITWGDVRRVDLGHLNIALSAATTYAMVLYSQAAVPDSGPFVGYSAPYGWDGARTPQQYPGGRAFLAIAASGLGLFSWSESAPDHDHFFQTIVSLSPIPEPGTVFLLAFGLAGLLGYTRAVSLRARPRGARELTMPWE